MLAQAGYRVDVVPSGEAALAQIATAGPDVVLSDFTMPGMNGSALSADLESRYPDLCRRFILMAGETTTAPVRAFLDRTRVPCLHKPIDFSALLRAVQEIADG